MTIYATFNPIGSTDPKDLIDNAQNLDYLILGPALTYPDRRGVNRLSWAGIEASFSAAQAQRASDFNAAQTQRSTDFTEAQVQRAADYAASEQSRGYENPVPYAYGIALTRVTQLVQYNSELYKAKAGTLPWTTTGVWATDSAKLVSVGDAALRQELASSIGTSLVVDLAPYTGASQRTQSSRNRDAISVLDFAGVFVDGITDSTAGINAAIAWCFANNLRLFWPYAAYLAAGNLVGFHSISHYGNGVITRGANAFYISPSAAETNNLYLSPTGSDSNDGLSSSFPRLTLIGAGAALEKFGPYLDGTWAVNLEAGTYSQSDFTFPSGLRGRNPVYFKGPPSIHPASPTAIIDGGGTGAFGINLNRENTVYLIDLWVRNYTSFGIVGQDGSMLYAARTHVTGVTGGPGVKMQQGRLVWSDGKVTNSQIGFSFIAGCTFTITSATPTLGSGTIIASNTQAGVQAQEQSSGHVDYAHVDTNPVGYQLVARSRVHSLLSVVTNCVTAAVRAYGASDWFNNQTSLIANSTNELFYTGSIEVAHYQNNVSPTRRPIDSTFVTHTGTSATTTLKTYNDAFLANNFMNSTKSMRFVVVGDLTGVAGNKNITINVGGVAVIGFTIPAAATGSYVIEGTLTALSAAQQTYHAICTANGVLPQVASGARGVAMNSGTALPITITATLVSSADSLTVRAVALFET